MRCDSDHAPNSYGHIHNADCRLRLAVNLCGNDRTLRGEKEDECRPPDGYMYCGDGYCGWTRIGQ